MNVLRGEDVRTRIFMYWNHYGNRGLGFFLMHGGVRSLYFHFPYAISSHHDRDIIGEFGTNVEFLKLGVLGLVCP